MKDRVRIGVTINHYLYGQGRQYTSDLEPLEVSEKALNDKILFQNAVKDYCEALASVMKPYNVDLEDYVLEFWLDDRMICMTLLSNYPHLFGLNIDDFFKKN